MKHFSAVYLVVTFLFLFSCGDTSDNEKNPAPSPKPAPVVNIPDFNADSAYAYIDKQVSFGPRVPLSEAHAQCAEWLKGFLESKADRVIVQEGEVFTFDGTKIIAKNIIASFQPENKNRVLLCAHWDTRPFADFDEDKSKRKEPILGASDGGSGVGVLLEIARNLKETSSNIGIDIILFDVEDYGQPSFSDRPNVDDSYCLGSQYWGKHPHDKKYNARFGILLDMVGAKNAVFPREGFSDDMAPHIVDKVWNAARELGYGHIFLNEKGSPIIDDHYYVNQHMSVPTIDIIQRDPGSRTGFGHYWHTHKDDMSVINKKTLKAVGQTVTKVIYEEQ